MNKKTRLAIVYALLAAVLFSIGTPFSKILLSKLSPTVTAACLYLGAGLGVLLLRAVWPKKAIRNFELLTQSDIPYVAAMIALDILSAILLMTGLNQTAAGNAALLSNFEIAATALVALFIFKEPIGTRLWLAIGLITLSCMLLSLGNSGSLSFSTGSLLICAACVSWGFENNCTKKLSKKDPLQIVMFKGLGVGLGSLVIAVVLHERGYHAFYMAYALLLGFLSYGLSIYFYISAQRQLGAAKTSAFYAIAPFIGAFLSLLLFRQLPGYVFLLGLLLMAVGAFLAATDNHRHCHEHETLAHIHTHDHNDGHHTHSHDEEIRGSHSHDHQHECCTHTHTHGSDAHHGHEH